MSKFKAEHTFDKRCQDSKIIREKYPERIPVIVELDSKSDIDKFLTKNKYLVPHDLSMNQFIYVIRKKINIPDHKAIYMFVNETLPPITTLLSALDREHRDPDGFLYITVCSEVSYG